VQFHLNPSGKLGFRRAHSSEGLDIQECHLPEAEINAVWPQIEFDRVPELDRVGLRSGQEGEVQLILESEQPYAPEVSVELLPISAVHLSPAGTLVLAGRDYLLIEVNRRAFKVSAGSFFQVNTALAGRMVDYLLESLPLSSEVTVLDAYCGVGLFSAFLAERAGRLIAVESSASAAEDFTVNLDEFDHVELYEAQVEQVLPYLDERVDVLVVDPPRLGLALQALDGILKLRPPVMAYISCDPATLARDAKRLVAGGYRLEEITPFDLFPQTYHIESISLWRSLSDSEIR
jgi:23S rRNA (uracil1939-C5)-methyltransferase